MPRLPRLFALAAALFPAFALAQDAAPAPTDAATPRATSEDIRAAQMPSPGGAYKPLAVIVDKDSFQLSVRGFGQFYAAPYAGKDVLLSAGDATEFRGMRVRRLGLGFEGSAAHDLSFGVWLDLAGDPLLSQAWLAWSPSTAFSMEAGVVRVPFSRSALQSSAELTFSERPISVDRLLPDRQPGVAIYGGFLDGLVSYRTGWFNGAAPSRLGQGPDHAAGLFAGRLAISPFGRLRPGQSDLARGPLRLEVAFNGMQDFAASYTSTSLGADLSLQVSGAALLVEYIYDRRSPISNPVTAPTVADKIVRTGLIAQASYQVWGPLELAARGELVDDNTSLQDVGDVIATAVGVHANFSYAKVGVDWYHRVEKYGAVLSNDTALAIVQGRF